MKLNPYLNFAGNAEEVINFYKDALGGEVVMLTRFEDSPIPRDDDWKQKIMHARIVFGGDNIIMISDAMKGSPFSTNGNIQLSIGLDDEAKHMKFLINLVKAEKLQCHLQNNFGVMFLECSRINSEWNGC